MNLLALPKIRIVQFLSHIKTWHSADQIPDAPCLPVVSPSKQRSVYSALSPQIRSFPPISCLSVVNNHTIPHRYESYTNSPFDFQHPLFISFSHKTDGHSTPT